MRLDGSADCRAPIGARRRGKNLCRRARQQGTAKQLGRGVPPARFRPPAAGRKGQHMKILRRRWWLAAVAAVAVVVSAVGATVASAGAGATTAKPGGLGQSSGLLPRDHLTLESAIQVNLSKETVRLPLYPGTANGKKVWYVLLDASDPGLAHDLGVNYAPKLAKDRK